MELATINTPIQVLDQLLALNLNVSLWTARTKLTPEDFGGVELPPDELASLGSKKICDPAKLAVFNKLKARAFTILDKHGVRFLSGWAIPEEKAGEIVNKLCELRSEFYAEKAAFLANYDRAIVEWIEAHPGWASIIADSTVSRDYVEKRLNFSWQMYRVAPAAGLSDENAMMESGLMPEVENLGSTLFGEVTKDARNIWKNVFEGKTEVTQKALSPLKTLKEKLSGLAFVIPHVTPVVDLIETAVTKMPKKGHITGASLLMLQGLVSILKDEKALVSQAEAMMCSSSGEIALAAFSTAKTRSNEALNHLEQAMTNDAPATKTTNIESMGLW